MQKFLFGIFMFISVNSKSQSSEKYLKLADIIAIDTTIVNYSIINDDLPYHYTAFSIQVPDGKIWKVDNIMVNVSTGNAYTMSNFSMVIKSNNTILYNASSIPAFASTTAIWIKSGTKLYFKFCNADNVMNGMLVNLHFSSQEYILE